MHCAVKMLTLLTGCDTLQTLFSEMSASQESRARLLYTPSHAGGNLIPAVYEVHTFQLAEQVILFMACATCISDATYCVV